MKNAYKILARKPEGKRTVGRPRCGWKYNIRTNLSKIGGKSVKCIEIRFSIVA